MTIRSHRPARRAVSSLMLVALAAAACGGGASTTPAGGGTAPSAAAASNAQTGGGTSSASPTGASPSTAAAGQAVNVCDLLPVAQVASITGQSLTQATENDTPALKSYGCYYGAAGSAGVSVTVDTDAAATFGTLMQEALALGGEQVSGLGDKAYHAVLGVNALFGDTGIFVSTDPAASALEPDAAAISLIKALQPKL